MEISTPITAYWVLALAVYSLKFAWPWFDRLTRYGKLQGAGAAGLVSNGAGFAAFYAFGALWNLALVGAAGPVPWARWLAPALFGLHLVRRLYECARVHVFTPRPMSGLNLAAGLSYYLLACATLSPLLDPAAAAPAAWQQALGGALFLIGSALQHWSHRVLAGLRASAAPRAARYHLPERGLFRYCDCPHYLAEITLYAGLLLLSPSHPARLLLLGFVALNLGHGAVRTHEWYRVTFPAYPHRRRALVPFVL